MLITVLILLVVDILWIAHAMVNAPVIDDEDNFVLQKENSTTD